VVDRVIPTVSASHQIKLQGTRNSRTVVLDSVKNLSREAYHIIASGDLSPCRVELQPTHKLPAARTESYAVK
jgi:hypothetical protein